MHYDRSMQFKLFEKRKEKGNGTKSGNNVNHTLLNIWSGPCCTRALFVCVHFHWNDVFRKLCHSIPSLHLSRYGFYSKTKISGESNNNKKVTDWQMELQSFKYERWFQDGNNATALWYTFSMDKQMPLAKQLKIISTKQRIYVQ